MWQTKCQATVESTVVVAEFVAMKQDICLRARFTYVFPIFKW